jgi:hypothetical protein
MIEYQLPGLARQFCFRRAMHANGAFCTGLMQTLARSLSLQLQYLCHPL